MSVWRPGGGANEENGGTVWLLRAGRAEKINFQGDKWFISLFFCEKGLTNMQRGAMVSYTSNEPLNQ